MGTVALKALSVPPSPDGYAYFDQITFGPGSPPGRPHPPGGGAGGGGPVDPGYSPPWAHVPGGGGGGGGPVDPGYSPPWAHVPGGGGGGVPSPGPGMSAVIIPLPPQEPPVPPPAGMSPGATQVVVWMGPGTKPTTGWVNPYASTGPVEPPAAPAQPA